MMKKITVKESLGYFTQRKTKQGFSITLTPRNRYLLANENENNIIPVDFDKNELLTQVKKEKYEFEQKLHQWYTIRQIDSDELIINDNLTLADYQHKALQMMFTLDRGLLTMDAGTGKTPVALSAIYYRLEGTHLVVCPKNVRYEWAGMLMMFFPGVDYHIIETSDKFTPKPKTVYIVNYERFIRLPEIQFDQIIFDEVHKLKSPSGVTNKQAYNYSLLAKHVWGLSGTIYGNDIKDVFGVCKVIEERLYGAHLGTFNDSYVISKMIKKENGDKYPKVIGYKNMTHFKSLLSWVSYHVALEDVVELPERTDTYIAVPKPNGYDTLRDEMILSTDNQTFVVDRQLQMTSKLQQFCSGFMKNDDGTWVHLNDNKINAFKEYIEERDEQMIIFTTYNESDYMLEKVFKELGKTYVMINGANKNADKDKEKFKKREVQFIVIKYATGVEGMNFQHCQKLLFYDLTPSYIQFKQGSRRIERRGQKEAYEFVFFLTEGSVEKKIYRSLKNNQDFSEYLMQGGSI